VLFDAPPASVQPQSVGDLIGQAFRIYRSYLPNFLKVLLGPTIVATLGAIGLQWAITYGLSLDSPTLPSPPVWALIGVSVLTLLGAKLILTVRQLAFVRIITGFAADYPSAHEFMKKRQWRLLTVFLVGLIWTVLATGLWAGALVLALELSRTGFLMAMLGLVGVLGAPVGIIACLCTILIVGFLVVSVIACEDQSLTAAISRGLRLTFANFPRSCGFSVLLYLAVTALSFPLSLPLIIVSIWTVLEQGVSGESFLATSRLPFQLIVFSQIWDSLINMLLWPAIFLAFGLFYLDLRLRFEGLDLDRSLDQLEAKAI